MGRGQELLDAAREGHSRTVEKLLAQITKRSGPFTSLRRGAGPNVQDDNGYTPLHHACLNGHREIIHSLLEMGASPCTVDKKGATPLHLAAFKGDAEAVAMLLDHNSPPVNVDQLTHDGDSALLIAAQFGFVNVVSQLVARGADVTVKNINGDSALDLAAHYGKLSVVRHLLHVRPQLVDQYMHRAECFTSTPLHRASMNGRKDVVIALIDAGMDPNVKTANGTPLHEAARFGKASVVRVLLNKGADLRAMDSRKKTVYDLLAEYPEEALRKVRKVIREYVTNAATYDSENEDLPPFPVPEYSPTPPFKLSPKLPANRTLRTNASSNNLNDDKQKDTVTKSPIRIKYPPSSKSPARSPVNDLPDGNFRERANTFQTKASNYKPLKILEDSLKSNTSNVGQLYDRQNLLISELERKHTKIHPTDPEETLLKNSKPVEEILYENIRSNTSPDNTFDRKRCNTLETADLTDASDTGSMKRKPKPLPKPVSVIDDLKPGDDDTDSMYVNGYFKKMPEEIYENVAQNIPDDEKVKNSFADEPNTPAMNRYIDMVGLKKLKHQRSTINVCGHSCDNMETYDDVSYVLMEAKMLRDKRISDPEYLSMNRMKTDSVHVRGDVGCIYGSKDYLYIYEINPKTVRGNVHPFIKKKEKASPMPCYCHEDPNKDLKRMDKSKRKPSSGSQLVYYSCEDIYVSMNREDVYSSLTNLKSDDNHGKHNFKHEDHYLNGVHKHKQVSDESLDDSYQQMSRTLDSRSRNLIKKKLSQVKQFVVDW